MFLKNKISIVFTACFLSAALAGAQTELPDENVSIIKDFDARLLESNKIQVSPTLPDLDTTNKVLDYMVPPKQAVVSYDNPTLRPIGMRKGKKEEVYNGYLKAGAGVPTSFYGEAGYYLQPSDLFDAKLWLRHHSAKSKALENQQFFDNDVRLNTNIFVNENVVVAGNIGYSFDRIHYYGYDHDSLSFDAEGVRQDYKLFTMGARVFNGERNDADINYFVEPQLYLMKDFFSNKETGFDFRLGATKWFAEKHSFDMVIRTDLTSYNDTVKQPLNNIYLQPSFTFHADFLKVKVGGNFASNRDIFYVFPDAEINLRIFGDGFQVFAGASGDLRKNTFRSMSTYNPFLDIRASELANTQYRDYYAGLKGNLGWLEYSGRVTYGQARDMALYQAVFQDNGITRFKTMYDTLDIFNLKGTVKLIPFKDLVVSGTFSSTVFDPRNELKAWGVPNIEGNFGAVWSLLEGKAQLKGNVYLADQISFRGPDGLVDKTGTLVDLSVGGSYYFAKNIGVFLDVNNMLNNKRERWYDYPMFGMNILGGITARF
ncbi:MAG: TonB-dependent receptor [Saprospiraceae bacterium]|jgi:hypothetical protein